MENQAPKVTLEPELELHAATLNAQQCRALARVYLRWAHQLQIKSKILAAYAKPSASRSMRPIARRQLLRN